ncbi:hypothetical protein [[Clostridium] fimetarium]|uniref:Uncharacterized protein n=1 Tax=[Clostridium] fimetarium TaxID=99656 RepID=A0A1I0RD75_9FIRM|nr:hypothetical protein [[Clostridium] fimetarium]SEW38794.1 hypothetical protein SAMN05421659_11441 [[Clostridium] fimetarium]
MKVLDLLEEKALLGKRYNSICMNIEIIGRAPIITDEKARKNFKQMQEDVKRYTEICDKLAEVNARTFIETDGRRMSVATALDSIRLSANDGIMTYMPGIQNRDEKDLYFEVNSRISYNIDTAKWNEDDFNDGKLVDPNNLIQKEDWYKDFAKVYTTKLTYAVQRSNAITEV